MRSRDLYVLSGPVNVSCLHAVLPRDDCGLVISLSFRVVTNRIDPEGRFRIVNGKQESLEVTEQEQQLLKLSKAELARRLAGLPPTQAQPKKRATGAEDGDPSKRSAVTSRRRAARPCPPSAEHIELERVLS